MKIAQDIQIQVSDNAQNVSFISDNTLLNRVLTNMIKNAVEASEKGQTVSVSSNLVGTIAVLSVHNQTVIPDDVQLQIFQRSFSTKGESRGIGTFSIRLITERYLKGKVHFESAKGKGTTFYVELPQQPEL
jgi:signal transduction histidine kinase